MIAIRFVVMFDHNFELAYMIAFIVGKSILLLYSIGMGDVERRKFDGRCVLNIDHRLRGFSMACGL